jgi:hypothetical protein
MEKEWITVRDEEFSAGIERFCLKSLENVN